jgi:homogentisate 1,2-dioxygenase
VVINVNRIAEDPASRPAQVIDVTFYPVDPRLAGNESTYLTVLPGFYHLAVFQEPAFSTQGQFYSESDSAVKVNFISHFGYLVSALGIETEAARRCR